MREVKGYGRQKSYLDQYADSEYSLAFLPKVEITLWVDDGRVEEILRKIVEVRAPAAWEMEKSSCCPAPSAWSISSGGASRSLRADNRRRGRVNRGQTFGG